MKSEERRQRQEAAGIPDTPLNMNPEALPTGESRILQAHINGVLVSELNLPPQVIAALDYNSTDEGIAEFNARPNVREASGITLGQDEFGKALEQRRDDVKERDYTSYEARDPLKEVADRFVGKGMRPKFLSAQRVKEGGGTGDYEVVKYPEGHAHQGDPVKVKGMVLGQIPETLAVARNKHFRDRGNQLLAQIEQKHKAEGGVVDPA